MQSERKQVSPLLYYTLLSGLTNLTFVVFGVVIFALSSLRIIDNIIVIVLTILVLWKGFLVGFLIWFFFKKTHNKEFGVKFIGHYLGRFFGIFIGGFLGLRIAHLVRLADITGIIVGALAFYFIGRWIGPKVSIAIGGQLDKLFSFADTPESQKVIEGKSPKSLFLVLFIIIFPLSFVAIGLMMNYFGIPVGYLNDWLPISRIVAIGISIFSICYPWLMRKRWLNKLQHTISSPDLITNSLGLSMSVVPTIYGFYLFFVMGASIIELCLFASASSLAAIIWIVNNQSLKE
jgi:hypothetical protein